MEVRKTVVNLLVCGAMAGVLVAGVELREAMKYYLTYLKYPANTRQLHIANSESRDHDFEFFLLYASDSAD